MTDVAKGCEIAAAFFNRVWNPPYDISAVDELMTPDYRMTTGGDLIDGREAFKEWLILMQSKLADAANEHLELFVDETGSRVVTRWVTRGRNNGFMGLNPDGRAVVFGGIAIWRLEGDLLAECWAEHSAIKTYNELVSTKEWSSSVHA